MSEPGPILEAYKLQKERSDKKIELLEARVEELKDLILGPDRERLKQLIRISEAVPLIECEKLELAKLTKVQKL